MGGNRGSRGLEEPSGHEEDLQVRGHCRRPDSFQRRGKQMPSNRTGSVQIKTRVGSASSNLPRVRQGRLERMTPAVDPEYTRLLEEVQPRVPRSKEENARLLAEAEKLMKKSEDNLSSAEDALLDTLFA